jgi:hypothetical protein
VKKFCGVGSRETPINILSQMTSIAVYLANNGWLLRSGGADGADKAFENGCDKASGKKEIYLPWRGFNGSISTLFPTKKAFELAATIHPAWNRCSPAARKLHARNTQQVLGMELNDPADLVICWTKNGKDVGGTATALKLSRMNNIRIINLAVDTFNFEEFNNGSCS